MSLDKRHETIGVPVGGVQVGSPNARQKIQESIRTLRIGDKTTLVILRDGHRQELNYFRID